MLRRRSGGRSRVRGRCPGGGGSSRRGRSGRTRTAGRPGRCPVPWSRTRTPCSSTTTSTSPPAAEWWAALSSRLLTARASRSGMPSTTTGSNELSNRTSGKSRRARVRHSATTRSSRMSSAEVSGRSPRASSITSPISALSSSLCSSTSASRRWRSSSVSRSPAISTSMFVRRLVIGVRSSCEASATSWRCARTDSSSAPRETSSRSIIALKRVASWPTSSSAWYWMRLVRSSVSVMCCAVWATSASGASTRPAGKPPEAGGERDPAGAQQEQDQAQVREDVADGGERPRELQGRRLGLELVTHGDRHRQLAQHGPADVHVLEVRGACRRCRWRSTARDDRTGAGRCRRCTPRCRRRSSPARSGRRRRPSRVAPEGC